MTFEIAWFLLIRFEGDGSEGNDLQSLLPPYAPSHLSSLTLLLSPTFSPNSSISTITVRHGEAMHNIAMAKYGSAWNPSWRHLDGDGEIVWGPGSELSEKGREQARVSRPGLSV